MLTKVVITGNTTQRKALTAALAEVGHYNDLLGRTTVQWVSMRNYRLKATYNVVIHNGVKVGATSKGNILLEATLAGETGKQAIRAVLDQLVGLSHVAPVAPGVTPVVYDPDAPTFYADETTNLFHLNHVGVEPAEFYPTKAEAIANGKVADGCVS